MKRERLLDCLILFALAAAAWKFTHHLGAVLDLPVDDDVVYLRRARAWLNGSPLDAAWGPLYSMSYGLLDRSWGGVAAYYLMSRVLIGALPLLTYGLARCFSPALPSAAVAFVVLISEANYQASPRVTHMALMAFIAIYLVARRFKDNLVIVAVSGVGLTVATYVRPEFALAALVLAASFFFLLFQEGRKQPRDLKRARRVFFAGAAWGLTVAVGCWLWGAPLTQERSWLAFMQHYLIRYGDHFPTSISTWNRSEMLMHFLYPDAENFAQMAWHHGGVVLGHFASNVVKFPRVLARTCFAHVPLFLPVYGVKGRSVEAAALFLMVFGFIWRLRGKLPRATDLVHRLGNRPDVWPLLVLPLPGLVANLYTLPYLRHFTPLAVLFWVWVAQLAPRERANEGAPASRAIWLVPFLLVAATPLLNSGWVRGAIATPLHNREMVNRISQAPLRRPEPKRDLRVFAQDSDCVTTFLGPGFTPGGHAARPFLQNMRDVDIIVPRFEVEKLGPYRNDPLYRAFAKNPERFGFTAFTRTGQLPFWVRQTLLAKSP